jgi:TetR/AcrR family transcriptional regulator
MIICEMMEKGRNVEQDIINAARSIFQERGFKEATMRDIAAKANINMAMLHYYFRSKDNLFYLVFDETFKILYNRIILIITSEKIDLFEKIRVIVDEYTSFFEKNPHLPSFIMGEIIRNPEIIGKRMKGSLDPVLTTKILADQLQEQYEKGIIRKTSVFSLLINIISLCVFPALAKSVYNEVSGIDPYHLKEANDERKKELADFIINALKIKQPVPAA